VAPTHFRRPIAALLAVALAVLVVVAADAARYGSEAHPARAWRTPGDAPAISFRINAAAQQAISWRGGPITASTGEVIRVFVSNSIPAETTSPEAWAEVLAGLTHGPELATLTSRIAPLEEVEAICGPQALGCYRANVMISPSEVSLEGTTPEEVLRHEYGHHIAFHRQNPPWRAIDWGPKHWASAANVCARTARNEAFPGDQGRNYGLNPGEAWAEVYRLMDERKAGITTGRWQVVAPSFYPNEAALAATERDVVQPWTKGTTRSYARTFRRGARNAWWIPLATPLDGELRLTATLSRSAEHEVALVAPNRRTVLARAQWVSQRSKRLSRVVCGQRTLYVRVHPSGAAGRVRLTVSTP
jgi:hypothetical protein